MTTPNIAKADIIEGFKYAPKSLIHKNYFNDDMQFILETAHLSPSSLVLNHGTLS
jgi:hypothetical protein